MIDDHVCKGIAKPEDLRSSPQIFEDCNTTSTYYQPRTGSPVRTICTIAGIVWSCSGPMLAFFQAGECADSCFFIAFKEFHSCQWCMPELDTKLHWHLLSSVRV